MGFGILFIGYVLAFFMSMTSYGYFFELVGVLLMVYSFTKLSEYNRKFKYAFLSAVLLALAAVYSVVVNIAVMVGYESFKNIFSETVFPLCKVFLNAVFHLLLFYSIADIAKDTEMRKIRSAAYRNMIFYGIYFVLQLVFLIPFMSRGNIGAVLGIAGNVLWISWVILDAIMIFSCYMNICDEGDTEMKAKPSRFAFINNIREEFDRRETKAREADKRYMQERSEKRKNKKKAKKEKNN